MVERFSHMAEVRAANAKSGRYFFEAGALRFFDSRIGDTLYGGRYFVTSERFHGSNGYSAARRYTIREAQYNGDIDTVGEFQAFATSKRAAGTIRALLGQVS